MIPDYRLRLIYIYKVWAANPTGRVKNVSHYLTTV